MIIQTFANGAAFPSFFQSALRFTFYRWESEVSISRWPSTFLPRSVFYFWKHVCYRRQLEMLAVHLRSPFLRRMRNARSLFILMHLKRV